MSKIGLMNDGNRPERKGTRGSMKSESYQHQVLFLSNSSFNLDLVAELIGRSFAIKHIKFQSASISSSRINPLIKGTLADSGIKLAHSSGGPLNKIKPYQFDLIITLGAVGAIPRSLLPAMLPHFHWEISEPGEATSEKDAVIQIKKIMEIIKKNIDALFNSDFLNTLFIARRHQQLILDNMLDGVMAHNENRTIFFFNRAAEKITSLKREDVLGKDCHDVFSGRFCGGDCDFCEGTLKNVSADKSRKRVDFKCPDGSKKILEMLTLPLTDELENNIGALVMFKDETELEHLKSHLKHHHALGKLITKDPKMLNIFEQIREVSAIQAPVLIEGESGTGKELVANAIHDMSSRAGKPFVAVNCGALPESILESELFGHVKGAFTGAIHDKKGRFELAHRGTLFLDEAAELSPAMQVKLLRALQEKCFERVGGEKLVHVDIRIISATNQSLKVAMKKKKFRKDLFYRLCVVPINIPPLRERRLDIPVLVEHFLDLVAAETERAVLGYTTEAIDCLSAYSWPGNVRELRNAIEYAYVKSRERVIRTEHLPPEIVSYQRKSRKKTGPPLKIKKEQVMIALEKTDGNRKEAAKLLGIGRATLYRYLDSYGLK
jgi:sigma-54 dependent transcriptional regulator, acetoin dehydrogenase operon transcriptional activator AcoR